MNRIFIFPITVLCTLLMIFFTSPRPNLPTAVSYTFSGGRFGDNLLAYARAKWISYTYKIPLLYRPFPYSDQMNLHDIEKPLTRRLQKKYTQKIQYSPEVILEKKKDVSFLQNIPYIPEFGFTCNPFLKLKFVFLQMHESILYSIPYFPEVSYEHHPKHDYVYFQVDWKDPEFRKVLFESIRPKKRFSKLSLPQNKHCVAVHIRTGRGYDAEDMYRLDPLKFPPIHYYIAQIKQLSKMLKNESLYVQIFTDDPNPQEIANAISTKLSSHKIEVNYFSQKKGVLEDFFAMQEFDYLIRSNSNFAILASLLKDYLICISPSHYTCIRDEMIIDTVHYSMHRNIGNEKL